MTNPDDPGPELLDRLFERLMIDEPWAVREDRSFTWWAHRLAQHVVADPPVDLGGVPSCTIRIRTEVVRDVGDVGNGGEPVDPLEVVAGLNARPTLNAVVWDPDERRIDTCCTAVVHAGSVGWATDVLATAALLANADAQLGAENLAEAVGGVPADSAHPTSGERPTPDSTLQIPALVIAREGLQPSRFAGELLHRAGQFLPRLGLLGFAEDEGLTCEVPFTGTRPVAEVMLTGEPPETSLVQVTTRATHPVFGHGAQLAVRLPVGPDPDDAAEVANDLNLLEATQDFYTTLLGAWAPDPAGAGSFGFSLFVPNLLARGGLLENLIIHQSVRSQFAAHLLLDGG
jgi:hypothetical protein